MTSMSGPAAALAASEAVYFHPHLFAREKALLDAATLLGSERKVDLSEIAEAMLQAALVDAERAGAIRLQREKASRLFGLRKVDALVVHAAGPASALPAGSLEARIHAAVEHGPHEVERVVHAVLGQDADVPHLLVLALVHEGLAGRGLLERRETKKLGIFKTESYHLPESTRLLAHATPGEDVRKALDAWSAARGADQELLVKGIRKGIAGRREASDGPD